MDAIGRDAGTAAEASRKLVHLGPAAVPALTQGLWADSASRRACLTLLGAIGADARPAAPSLVRLLGDDSPETREIAARALGVIGAHSAAPALAKLLDDKFAGVRLGAAQSLIHLGADAETLLPMLTKALKSEGAEEAYAAARLFGELGPEAASAVPALNNELPAADPVLTALLADALGRIGPGAKDAVPTLKTKVLENKNSAPYRVAAAVAMWRIARDPDAAPSLREALTGAKTRTRPHAPLWRIDPSKETTDALVQQLKAEDLFEVLLAAQVLGNRSKDTLPALLRILKSDDFALAFPAAALLGEIGPGAKDALEPIQKLADGKTAFAVQAAVAAYRIAPTPQAARALTDLLEEKDARLAAAEAIKELRPTNQAVLIELLAALDSPDEQVRLAAAVALWRIEKHAQAIPSVIKRLRSADPRVREQAATEIGGEFGADAKTAVPELVKRLFDPFAGVRSASAEALGRIGPGAADAVKPLLALLDGDEPAFVQSAACEALGLIQPTDKDDALILLKKKLEHSDALVRAHAALALLLLGDKGGAPEAAAGLRHRTHYVRITAAETVWRMNQDARAVPLLVRALEESNLDGTGGENERYMAVRALGRIGKDAKPAVPELLKLINHRDHALATAARAALKLIDPDALKK